MRVLFALSCSEREEEKIIQCYKEKYGENLDVTSVYFFKSLIDTVRKSEPFDRIIIHENLEATGRKNKEVFDDYIFNSCFFNPTSIKLKQKWFDESRTTFFAFFTIQEID